MQHASPLLFCLLLGFFGGCLLATLILVTGGGIWLALLGYSVGGGLTLILAAALMLLRPTSQIHDHD
jgi:hypothetical protein